jgi:hypothetical protein
MLHDGNADFRCGPPMAFFAAASFAGFLPAIGISFTAGRLTLNPNHPLEKGRLGN